MNNVSKNKKKGQGMTEYMIIVGLIAVSAIAAVRATSKNLQTGFGRIGEALRGEGPGSSLKYTTLDSTQVKDRDLGDFSNDVKASGGGR